MHTPFNTANRRVCVLGGYGAMGSAVVEHLLRLSDAHILIADKQVKEITKVYPYSQGRLSQRRLDALRPESIRQTVEKCDLVFNCIGPFYRYGTLIAQTVISMGINLIDICNNSGTTQGILDFDTLAREMGVTCITGVGFTPGLSNLLVMKAVSQMEQVDAINIHWASSLFQPGGESLLEHVLTMASDEVPFYSNHLRTRVRAFSDPEPEKFPHPIGIVTVAQSGHPEVVTLPHYVDARTVSVKGGLLPGWVQRVAVLSGRTGLTGVENFRRQYGSFLTRAGNLASPWRHNHRGLSALKVNVRGTKLGQPVVVALNTMGSLRTLTALPAMVAALFLLNGSINKPGVYPPEGCVDEERALIQMSRYGLVYTFSERYLDA